MDNRQKTVEALRYFYNGLVRLEEAAARRQQADNQIVALQNQLREAKSQAVALNEKSNFTKKTITTILSIIVIALFALVDIILPIALGTGISLRISAIFNLALILFIVNVVGRIVSKKKTWGDDMVQKAYMNSVPQAETSLKNTVLMLPQIDCELACAYAQVEAFIKGFPPKYTYSYAVGKFAEYMENMRVDSIKEAINLFEQEEWQNNMLNESRKQTAIQAEQLAVQKDILNTAKNIEDYAKRAAEAAEDIKFTNQLIANNTAAAAAYAAQAAQSAKNTEEMLNYVLG